MHSSKQKKKIFKIRLVYPNIITKNDFFQVNLPLPEKNYGLQLSSIYRSNFEYLFFVLKNASRATNSKKDHQNPITGLQDNAFFGFKFFSPNLYNNLLPFLGGLHLNAIFKNNYNGSIFFLNGD